MFVLFEKDYREFKKSNVSGQRPIYSHKSPTKLLHKLFANTTTALDKHKIRRDALNLLQYRSCEKSVLLVTVKLYRVQFFP